MDNEKISQNQLYDIVTGRKPDWQAIIYDLIHAEQLDPWDINLILLTDKYFEKITELERADFYVSSKVLLAAALLLRIKSEFLLDRYIKSIDEILFGKKEKSPVAIEKIELNEDELPFLIPKTPLPRARRVTLSELMTALDKAISTESRRIRREVNIKRAKKLSEVDFPSFKRIDLKDRIREFYARVLTVLKKKKSSRNLDKVGYSELVGEDREQKLACFLPLLHLSNSQKLWLEQEMHLEEIWVYLHEYFKKNKDKFVETLEEDIEEMKEEFEIDKQNIGRQEEMNKIREEISELFKESIKQEIIEGITGFEDEQ